MMGELDLRQCAACGKAFVARGAGRAVCPECRDEMDGIYQLVRDLMRDHPRFTPTVKELSVILGVEERKIQALVDDGRIAKSEPHGGSARCQSCGAPIRGGNLCDDCSRRIHQDVLRTKKNKMYARERHGS